MLWVYSSCKACGRVPFQLTASQLPKKPNKGQTKKDQTLNYLVEVAETDGSSFSSKPCLFQLMNSADTLRNCRFIGLAWSSIDQRNLHVFITTALARVLLPDMSSEPLLPCQDTEGRPISKYFFKFHSSEGDTSHSQPSHVLAKELIVAERGPWLQFRIKQWGQQKVIDPFVVILKRGLEPKLLSLSAALGLALGVFPICGVPLLFCAVVALVLRSNCHVPTLMLGNFVASFFELGLVVPYMRAGEMVTGGEHFPLSTGEFWEALKGHESHTLMFGMLHAIIGWSVFLPMTVALLYITFLPFFMYLAARIDIPNLPLHQSQSHDSANVWSDSVLTSNPDGLVYV